MKNRLEFSITMGNQIEKNHSFKLDQYCLRWDIASTLKHKNTYIEYKCLWEENEDNYFPVNLELIKIWRDADQTDNISEKILWNADELSKDWYDYFNSGLRIHAESISSSIKL